MERKLIEDIGGAPRVLLGLREYRRRVERMESLRPELLKQHPGKWVVMHEGDIAIVADSLEGALEEVDRLELPRGEAVIEFLDPKPKSMIL